ncbi:substrate-binding domain-containing protein [Desulfosarcina ovata]|uniref:Uncharacterized protein n=1 Tax=Desulfosarcina ovata subsp. ovata TaxID=2752305 RepID=A0A5K8AFY6_9BACT|nr:substrate-binding domain-containing protein [Desulfosarcina ovata]BBO91595.1 hypothetical protein DSCOOX_47750 [Desulfosarcina ovata subsp. ovata]
MNKGRYLLILAIGGLVLLVAMAVPHGGAWAADVRVIANKGIAEDSVDANMVKDIFLGKKSSWSDGSPIEFVILESGSDHDLFLKTYVKKTAKQFSTYWKKQVFTGKGAMPKAFASEGELISYVSGNSGVVGYVSGAADTASVKVISEQ